MGNVFPGLLRTMAGIAWRAAVRTWYLHQRFSLGHLELWYGM